MAFWKCSEPIYELITANKCVQISTHTHTQTCSIPIDQLVSSARILGTISLDVE